MYRWKYPKTNLRNPKHINPNPKDSDQRERKRSEGEKDLDQKERKTQAARALGHASPRIGSHAAWGSRAAWVCLGRTRWSEADLKPPTPISIFSLFLFLVFFFFFLFSLGSSLMFWWFLSGLFLFIRDIN